MGDASEAGQGVSLRSNLFIDEGLVHHIQTAATVFGRKAHSDVLAFAHFF